MYLSKGLCHIDLAYKNEIWAQKDSYATQMSHYYVHKDITAWDHNQANI